MDFRNAYQDATRAAAYDQLEFPGTYHLAFRDLPELLQGLVPGRGAVDFGCGTGRSARFLKELGYEVTGLDIAEEMVAIARRRDPSGDYRVIADGDFSSVPAGTVDLVLSAFTFDNVLGRETKVRLFAGLRTLLAPRGRLINLVSTPEMYVHEWASFTTRDYPENRLAACGEVVRIVTTDHPDRRPVEDVLCTDEAYRAIYRAAGLEVVDVRRPLARGDEGVVWVSEREVAPWAIYVLKPGAASRSTR